MKLTTAIKELRRRRDHWADMNDRAGVESSQLGIEAAKRIQADRFPQESPLWTLLPGETPED